ncbi:hypothetical protein [Bifidobacterium favimelis]|uniref:Uncharacterized protein n=1 Tax=Bifidobacterium favimelis TaxID=3122979 RepID=A0ABU8ZMC9_9BIFI
MDQTNEPVVQPQGGSLPPETIPVIAEARAAAVVAGLDGEGD